MTPDWLANVSAKTKLEFASYFHEQLLKEAGIYQVPADLIEPDEVLQKLPVWQRTSTCTKAISCSKAGAAVLPKSPIPDSDLPRVEKWQQHLLVIGRFVGGRRYGSEVRRFLSNVIFWHHQSTSGRMNKNLGRWERYGVLPVERWRIPHGDAQKDGRFSPRSFARYRRRLGELGLIDARSHLWQQRTYLWVKPTEELSRIVFEVGYWANVKHKYLTPVASEEPGAAAGKPRGLSALHKVIDEESKKLYSKAVTNELSYLSHPERWAIWERLSKPIPMGPKALKKPFFEKGSGRYKRLHAALFQS